MTLYGELLKQSQLRFNYSSESARDTFALRGLVRFGPYDSNLFPKDKINACVLYPAHLKKQKDVLVQGLNSGEGRFQGFKSLFKIPIDITDSIAFSPSRRVSSTINESLNKSPDIVFLILPPRQTDIYPKAKSRLLANGLPSQMITLQKLANPYGRSYTLENVALSSYAKVGGTPWTISSKSERNDLILGISRAQDASKRYLVGYVTLFTKYGDFLFLNSGAPVVQWEDYVKRLSDLIGQSLEEFRKEFEAAKGAPTSLVVHFHKKPGRQELAAIEKGLSENGRDIPYAIIHLNEYTNYRLFNSAHASHIPPKGFKVALSEHESLLLLDGAVDGKRRRMGVPRVLDIRMDRRSTLSTEHFPEIVQQVFDFAHLNWRGFNASAIPITLNYSKLIARMVADLGTDTWNEIVAEGRLRDKAWFL